MSILFSGSSAIAPFRLSSSPDDVFVHPAWQRAHEECRACLTEGGRVLLCGVPGTGKSLLLQHLTASLRAEGRAVSLLQHGDLVIDAAERDILLIDEADRLSSEQIRRLCLLPNPLVLAGLPRLRELAAGGVGLIGSTTLEALTAADVARLVTVRLSESGRAGTMFAPDAVKALTRRSGGLFRVVIILAGAALFFAELRGAGVVTAADIDEAAAMREAIADEVDAVDQAPLAVPAIDASRWPRRVVMAVVAMVAAIGVGAHLSVTVGGPAAAEPGRVAAGVPLPPPPAPALSPKRPLGRLG